MKNYPVDLVGRLLLALGAAYVAVVGFITVSGMVIGFLRIKPAIPILIFLLCSIPAQAQGPIHLPLIEKDKDCLMVAALNITDGSESISLLETNVGFFLKDWTRTVIPQNVTFRQSPLTPGRRPVSGVYATTEETFALVVRGHGQDGLIAETQKLLRLLNKSLDFWITDWQDEVVYIEAQAACETNLEYAEIVSFRIPELGKSYQQPFHSASELAALDNFTLIIERKHWKANAPGTGACAEASGVQEWQYEEAWQVNVDTTPDTNYSLLQTANGYIYVGQLGDIIRSTDNGASWGANTALPAAVVNALIQTANGDIYAGDNGQILRSIDNGASWQVNTTLPAGLVGSLLQTADGYIYAGEVGQILRSIDNGASWQVNTTLPVVWVESLMQATNGDIYASDDWQILRSTDNGTSWQVNTTLPVGPVHSIIQTMPDGYIYAVDEIHILRSIDNGVSWQVNLIQPPTFWKLFQATSGYIYVSTNTNVMRSVDFGTSWQEEVITPRLILSYLQTANGYIYAGERDDIYWMRPALADMGRSATCLNEIYIANKQSIGNFTHIKIDDGGAFTDIFPIAAYPQTLLPAVPAVNDALYLGQETSITDTGPFNSAVFDIATPATSTTSYTLIYEYWNGAWVALTVQDNTATATGSLRMLGVNSVHWEQPSDWATTAIDGVTAYWIRIELSALNPVGGMTPPTQQNRDIYTVVYPYVNIADTVVSGDIPALLQAKLTNQSDADGRSGDPPNLWDNRIFAGLRSYDRGDLFQAYLNVSDEQQPVGVTVTDTGANTAFAADVTTPTGRNATYNPAGVEAMATQVTIALGPTIARDFYGTFHAYIRARRTAGDITDFDVQLQVATGSGGISFTTESQQLQTTTAFEVLDFGVVTIPASGSLKTSELGDITELRIQASAASGTPNLEMYDLILIPTDEWAGDFVDFANSDDSIIGRDDDLAKLLDIDSVTDPKKEIQSLVRQADTDLITSIYNPITNGAAILQSNAQQRLWFFVMQTDQTSDYDAWIAPPEIGHSVQLYHNARYLGLRGTD